MSEEKSTSPTKTRTQVRVFVGDVSSLADGTFSAINKSEVLGTCYISTKGLQGDIYADSRHHGGPDRALLYFPALHYETLCNQFPHMKRLKAGQLGENLSGVGLMEPEVCIGDIFVLGTALLQISQPRSPCFKLGLQTGDHQVPKWVQDRLITGYFFRVLQPGNCHSGDELNLTHRSEPELTVAQAGRIYFSDSSSVSELEFLRDSPGLCERWKSQVSKRLAMGIGESQDKRLYGPDAAQTYSIPGLADS